LVRALRFAILSLALLGAADPRSARAQSSEAPTAAASTPSVPRKASLWRDDWPQFRTSEAILTGLAAIGTAVIVAVGPIEHARWQGGILFDDAVRSELRAGNPVTRRHLRTVGDYSYHLSPVLPLVDVLVLSALGHSDRKLALNLGAIMLEAYSYTGISAFVSTEISARARPDSGCTSSGCKADTQSFFSGHAAISATGAGLVCANHTRIPLWGNPVADGMACGVAVSNALLTATTRVVADRHYASDVLVGLGMGFGIGYGVPVLLHYSYRGNDNSIAVGPDPACGGSCIGVTGSF
jgi:membrane-associated phospholipid phosphatase